MKLRLMGTREECDELVAYFRTPPASEHIRSISEFYPNRGTSKEGRVYIETFDLHPGDLRPVVRRD